MKRYVIGVPVMMMVSVLVPVALVVQWISEQLLTLTIDLIDLIPEIDS